MGSMVDGEGGSNVYKVTSASFGQIAREDRQGEEDRTNTKGTSTRAQWRHKTTIGKSRIWVSSPYPILFRQKDSAVMGFERQFF